MNKHPSPLAESGFSLLEVLVAFAILSISLPAIFSVYSAAFRSAASARSYATATQLADAKLNEIASSSALSNRVEQGMVDERYRWTAMISGADWQDLLDQVDHPLMPYEIRVSVSWTEGTRDRAVLLTTVKLARRQ